MARVVVKNRNYRAAVNTPLAVSKQRAVVAKKVTAVSCTDDDMLDDMDNYGPPAGLQGPPGSVGTANPHVNIAPSPTVWFTTTPSVTNYVNQTAAMTTQDQLLAAAIQHQMYQQQLAQTQAGLVGAPSPPMVRKYHPPVSLNKTSSNVSNHVIVNSGITVANSSTYFNVIDDDCCTPDEWEARRNNGWKIPDGVARIVTLPDGAKLDVKADGSYEMIDKDAKVVYRACRVRDFNPFLNASDKLEDFIRFCGTVGVKQSEVLRLPVELFVAWLVIAAAKADGEPEPDLPLVPKLKRRALPRCTSCGQFLSRLKRQKRLDFCAPKCFETFYDRALVPA